MDQMVLVFVPALIAVLVHEENELGRDLTKEEVEQIRDEALCMQVPLEGAIDLEKERGYDDIRPECVWEDWLEYKAEVNSKAPH